MGEPIAPKILVRDMPHELGRAQQGAALDALADQLLGIAEQLRASSVGQRWLAANPADTARLSGDHTASPSMADRGHPIDGSETDRKTLAQIARRIYASRRERETIFGNAELFGEPAWDILLDLYIAHADDKPVSVSSACIGSASPPTTGLRWLGILAQEGLILREHDPLDQRRVLVRLSDAGLAAMDTHLSARGILP